MGNFFLNGGGLFIQDIARVGWLRSLLWRWDESSRGKKTIAQRLPLAQAA